MNINSINQQYGLYGGMGQSFSRSNQTQTMNMSGQMGPQAAGFMGGGGGQVTAAYGNNMNSVWVDLQTSGASSVDEQAIAEEMLANEQEKFTEIDTDGDGVDQRGGIHRRNPELWSTPWPKTRSPPARRGNNGTLRCWPTLRKLLRGRLDTDEDGTVSEDEFTAEIQSRLDAIAESGE